MPITTTKKKDHKETNTIEDPGYDTDREIAIVSRQIVQASKPEGVTYLLKNTTLYTKMFIDGLNDHVLMLIDTGAAVSLIPMKIYLRIHEDKRILQPNTLDIRAGNDTPILCFGVTNLKFAFQYYLREFKHDFYVCDDDTSCILGMDFLAEYDTCIHLAEEKFSIDDVPLATFSAEGTPIRRGPMAFARV